MVITHQGLEAFKITLGDTVLAINPPSKKSDYKSSSFGSDIALITSNHKDFNGVDEVTRGDKKPFVITGAGEYEIHEVFIRGLHSKTSYDGNTNNTIYLINLEDINICFMGAVDSVDFSDETKQALEEIDILFVPIGGDGTLTAEAAYKLAVSLEPSVIVPMHYEGVKGGEKELKTFLKEGGVEKVKPIDKLTIKKKDVESMSGEIVVLSQS